MRSPEAVFIFSDELSKYPYPSDCPFNNGRSAETKKILDSMGLLSYRNMSVVRQDTAQRTVLKNFHTARYLHALKNAPKLHPDIELLRMGLGTPDCPVFRGMYEGAALGVGATLKGVELILEDKAGLAFNPAGGFHHAGPELCAGFCYLNDVALACKKFADAGKRVFYLDIDVHHGDEVAYPFYDRSDIMTVSFHQNGRTLFPGTGFEEETGDADGKGYCINLPLPVGTYDEAYMYAYKELVPPLIKVFDPDVFVFELGADTLSGDPLANLQLTNNTYADVINNLLSFDRPILMTGGGGYNISNTARAWAFAWSVLTGNDTSLEMGLGAGGVMMESTDWQGGLRDRQIPVTHQQSKAVEPSIENSVKKIQDLVFPIHGIDSDGK